MNEVLKAMQERRSFRAYMAKPVEEELLQQVITAGTYAASGGGRQSARIVVLQNREDVAQLERMNAAVMGKPDAHPFYGAGTVLVVLVPEEASTGLEDGSLVIGNMMLAAHTVGLGSCWIHRAKEEFASDEGKALLKKWGFEGNWRGVGHCILGYPAVDANEAAPRKADYIVRV